MDNCTQWWIITFIGCMWFLKEVVSYMQFRSKIDTMNRKSDEKIKKICQDILEKEKERKRNQQH